jgi:hypothetical protein
MGRIPGICDIAKARSIPGDGPEDVDPIIQFRDGLLPSRLDIEKKNPVALVAPLVPPVDQHVFTPRKKTYEGHPILEESQLAGPTVPALGEVWIIPLSQLDKINLGAPRTIVEKGQATARSGETRAVGDSNIKVRANGLGEHLLSTRSSDDV